MSYSYVLGNISYSIKRQKQSVKAPDMATHMKRYAYESLWSA